MQRVQVQLTAEQVARLALSASERRTSVAAVVREAVDLWLGEAERRRRIHEALAVVGAFHSGVGDLAEHHDEHLADPT